MSELSYVKPIVEKCNGCGRAENGYCKSYAVPETLWKISNICPMATHIKVEAKQEKKINPLKQSKQAMRNKKK